jgi:predicted phosphodiesterase
VVSAPAKKHLKHHTSGHLVPEKNKMQDFEHPNPENLSYDTYIVGAWHNPETTWEGMNFIFSDGSTSGLPTNKNHVESII